MRNVPAIAYRRQIEIIRSAWSARSEAAAIADVVLDSRLSGIDSDGISMLARYAARRRRECERHGLWPLSDDK